VEPLGGRAANVVRSFQQKILHMNTPTHILGGDLHNKGILSPWLQLDGPGGAGPGGCDGVVKDAKPAAAAAAAEASKTGLPCKRQQACMGVRALAACSLGQQLKENSWISPRDPSLR
jgi:hypothetical protein